MNRLKHLILILIVVYLFGFITTQATTVTKSGSKTVVARVLPNQGDPYYSVGTFGHDIGGKYVSEAQETEVARTLYTFDIASIPSNAIINSVTLNVTFSGWANNYQATITFADYKTGPVNQWPEIGDASAVFSSISYSSGGGYSNASLKSDLQSAVGSSSYLTISGTSWT